MNSTNTGVAVGLAVIVIAIFFVVPGLSPFKLLSTAQPAAATIPTQTMENQNTDQLQVMDQAVGTGTVAESGDEVTVQYVGALADGTIFDASANHGQPFTFTLGTGQVIAGWDQGVAGMKEGGKRTLVIPPALAYGDTGVGKVIPPGATLTFQVELVKVVKGKK